MDRLLSIYRYTLRASTLVEVLVAMVILLSVFGAGMVLFSRLILSPFSAKEQEIKLNMEYIAQRYAQGNVAIEASFEEDHINYFLEWEELEDYPDRIRIQVFALHSERGELIDSLKYIMQKHEDQN